MIKKTQNSQEDSSFRDPDGFIFYKNNKLYRQVNSSYKQTYDDFMRSGLYEKLVSQKFLVSHKEVRSSKKNSKIHKIIAPQIIPFISYPYEWSFGMLKQAALLTLKIQKLLLQHNMTLKDASAYNVQFIGSKPIFIDTLSVDSYVTGSPWIAYRQFCQHFLAPLSLMKYKSLHLNQLLKNHIDGIPLSLASSLLPPETRLNLGLLTHIHLHAKSQSYFSSKNTSQKSYKMDKKLQIQLIDNLSQIIKGLNLKKEKTVWSDYYTETNYSKSAFLSKKTILKKFVKQVKPKVVLDLGANTGEFSEISALTGAYTISADFDPMAVERLFVSNKKYQDSILPLVIDLVNPSPAIGWDNLERKSFLDRAQADMTFALALIHHLTIFENIPLHKTAKFFAKMGKYLVIEFIPKEDSQAQRLLRNREDIFVDYEEEMFEKIYSKYFTIQKKVRVKNCQRVMYLMKRKRA